MKYFCVLNAKDYCLGNDKNWIKDSFRDFYIHCARFKIFQLFLRLPFYLLTYKEMLQSQFFYGIFLSL